MGALADALPRYDHGQRGNHGKAAACDIYGPGDIDDWRAVIGLQSRPARDGGGWDNAQTKVDELLGITNPCTYHQFVHHWRRKCGHWTAEQRAETL